MGSLEELGTKIAKLQEESKPKPKRNTHEESSGAGFIAVEMVAGISIGGFFGYYFDQYFHTKALFLLIFIILGLISSLYNIYKKYK